MRRLIALAALVALVTSACKIETNFGAVINPDGSGTIIFEFGMDDEAQGFLGDDPFEDQDLADLPGARQSTERRGDMTFWVVTADVDDITDFQDEIVGGDSLLDSFSITITDSRVTVRGSASADDAFGGGDDMFDAGMFEDVVTANVRITMPGSIISHNADSQNGNELTWRVPVTGGTLDIQAESDPTGSPASGGGGFPIWLIVVLAAVVALAVVYFLNKKKAAPAAAGTAPMTEPTTELPAEPTTEPPAGPTTEPPAPPADE